MNIFRLCLETSRNFPDVFAKLGHVICYLREDPLGLLQVCELRTRSVFNLIKHYDLSALDGGKAFLRISFPFRTVQDRSPHAAGTWGLALDPVRRAGSGCAEVLGLEGCLFSERCSMPGVPCLLFLSAGCTSPYLTISLDYSAFPQDTPK